MTESGDWHERVVQKVSDETDLIVNAFAEAPDGRVIKVVTANGGIDFMYSEGEILVREDHLERVLEILEQRAPQRLEIRAHPLPKRAGDPFVAEG